VARRGCLLWDEEAKRQAALADRERRLEASSEACRAIGREARPADMRPPAAGESLERHEPPTQIRVGDHSDDVPPRTRPVEKDPNCGAYGHRLADLALPVTRSTLSVTSSAGAAAAVEAREATAKPAAASRRKRHDLNVCVAPAV
jgi:hypothetical protein